LHSKFSTREQLQQEAEPAAPKAEEPKAVQQVSTEALEQAPAATAAAEPDELPQARDQLFSSEYYTSHFRHAGQEAFEAIHGKFAQQASSPAEVPTTEAAEEQVFAVAPPAEAAEEQVFADAPTAEAPEEQVFADAPTAEAPEEQVVADAPTAEAPEEQVSAGTLATTSSPADGAAFSSEYYSTHFRQAGPSLFASLHSKFSTREQLQQEAEPAAPKAEEPKAPALADNQASPALPRKEHASSHMPIEVEVTRSGPLGIGVVPLPEGGVGVSSVRTGGNVDRASQGKVMAGMLLLRISGQPVSSIDVVVDALKSQDRPVQLAFCLRPAEGAVTGGTTPSATEAARPSSRPNSTPDNSRPSSSPDSRAALQNHGDQEFAVEVEVQEGPLGIGLVPMPGGGVGVSSVKDGGNVNLLSKGKVRAGMCFSKANGQVVASLDEALVLLKTRPIRLNFTDAARSRRVKDRPPRPLAEETDPFPKPPAAPSSGKGVGSVVEPTPASPAPVLAAAVAAPRMPASAASASAVPDQWEGCLTFEVSLAKDTAADKFGFVQASGKIEFEQRMQQPRDKNRRATEQSEDGDPTKADVQGPSVLVVRRIHRDGILDRWNKANPAKEVQVQDQIAAVNGHTTIEAMQQQLREMTVQMLVIRLPERFTVKLSKDGGRLGLCFERPSSQSMAVAELRISEVMKAGALPEYNRKQASLGRHQYCVLPEMRIEAVNGESRNINEMVDRLKGSAEVELRIRRAIPQEQVSPSQSIASANQPVQAFGATAPAGFSDVQRRPDGETAVASTP